jgi:CARDB
MLPFLSFFEELDFGDEEQAPRQRQGPRLPRRRGGGEDRPVQWRRLALLAVALAVVLIAGYWYVTRCQHNQDVASYHTYVQKVNAVNAQATNIAGQLQTDFLDPNQKPTSLAAALTQLAQLQQSAAQDARRINPPAALATVHIAFVWTQELRAEALRTLAGEIPQVFNAVDATSLALPVDRVATATASYQRLSAADILYTDLFVKNAEDTLASKGITGVSFTNVAYLNPALAGFTTPDGMSAILQGIYANSNPKLGNTRGTSITATPPSVNNVTLDPTTTVSVPDTSSNGSVTMAVTDTNTGAVEVTNVRISAYQSGQLIGSQLIPTLAAGASATVHFTFIPPLTVAVSLKAKADPVPGETNLTNNVFIAKARFKLGA